MSDDIRVLLVKLADRLHNMRTLHFIKNPDKRRRIAKETMDIYAPLAERIGMYEYMREMQLLAFRELEPEAYATITGRLAKLTAVRQGQGRRDQPRVQGAAREKRDRGGRVGARKASLFDLAQDAGTPRQLSNRSPTIIAFRVITRSDADCYAALGVFHRKWKMVPRSLQGLYLDPQAQRPTSRCTRRSCTMKICGSKSRSAARRCTSSPNSALPRTGPTSRGGGSPDGQAGWIRDLLEILDQTHDPDELLENTRIAMYQDRIFAFTPKGSLFQLPKGRDAVLISLMPSTTGLGDRTVGAKVNGRLVPLRTQLVNGDYRRDIVIGKADAAARVAGLCGDGQGARRDPPPCPVEGKGRTRRPWSQDVRRDRPPPAQQGRRQGARRRARAAEARG